MKICFVITGKNLPEVLVHNSGASRIVTKLTSKLSNSDTRRSIWRNGRRSFYFCLRAQPFSNSSEVPAQSLITHMYVSSCIIRNRNIGHLRVLQSDRDFSHERGKFNYSSGSNRAESITFAVMCRK